MDVRVSGLVHIYRTEGQDVAALSGVSLDVEAGTTLALLGPSGAGKSTLLMLIAGLDRPTAGTISVGGHALGDWGDAELDRRRGQLLGLVLQGGARNLLGHLTLRQNIEFAGLGAADAPTATRLLEWVGVDDSVADRRPAQVSPAQAQLAALCVGAASAPALLLADEPTASLGPGEGGRVVQALQRINAELGSTVLTVTHDPALASAMHRTVTIRDGRVGAQAEAGVDIALVAPDGSLPLPDHVLGSWPSGTAVQVETDGDGEEQRLVVRRWIAEESE